MNEQYEVWKKIINFNFPKGFKERLARERGWDISFTEDAMNEYLKFMFLTKFAGHGVTPSEIVDEVWHLHLIYSESYDNDLCAAILGKKVHHNPGTGDEDDGDVFRKQYIKTLDSYKSAFGVPPHKYWPKPKSLTEVNQNKNIPSYKNPPPPPPKKSLWDRLRGKKEDNNIGTTNSNNSYYGGCSTIIPFDASDGSSCSNSHCSNHGGGSSHCSTPSCSSGGDSGGGGSSCSSSGGSSCGSSCGSGCGGGCGS